MKPPLKVAATIDIYWDFLNIFPIFSNKLNAYNGENVGIMADVAVTIDIDGYGK